MNFGHPTNVTLARCLRRSGAKKEFIGAVWDFRCDACGDMIRTKHVRPVRMPGRYQFNFHVMLDTLFGQDADGNTHAFLNIMCDGTRFQVAWQFHIGKHAPSAKIALEISLTVWASWAGLPQSIFVDRGKEFAKEFLAHMFEHGVETQNAALEAHEQMGRIERMGGIWKEVFHRVVQDAQITKVKDLRTVCGVINQVRNETVLYEGFAPSNWVLGTRGLRIPGSILQDGGARPGVRDGL